MNQQTPRTDQYILSHGLTAEQSFLEHLARNLERELATANAALRLADVSEHNSDMLIRELQSANGRLVKDLAATLDRLNYVEAVCNAMP